MHQTQQRRNGFAVTRMTSPDLSSLGLRAGERGVLPAGGRWDRGPRPATRHSARDNKQNKNRKAVVSWAKSIDLKPNQIK